MNKYALAMAIVAVLTAAACAHAQPEQTLRCGEPHTRAQAAEVISACDREIALATNAPAAERVRLLYGRGVALTNTRDLDVAIQTLGEVLALDPTHVRAYRLRGYVYWRQRRFDLAEADTEAALRIDPNMAMA